MKKYLIIFASLTSLSSVALDNPLPPVDPTAVLSADYLTVDLTWGDPGVVGENGGEVDPALLTYYIFDAFGSFYAPAIATTTDTHYTFDYSSLEKQDFVAYQLTAGMQETWYSLPVNSNIVCVGAPAELPFVEDFANGKYANVWCIDPASGYNVTAKVVKGSDAPYLSMKATKKNEKYGIISVKAATAEAHKPAAKVSVQGSGASIQVLAAADGGEFVEVGAISPTTDVLDYEIDLAEVGEDNYVQVELMCAFPTTTSYLSIYGITIYDADPNGDTGVEAAISDAEAHAEYFTLSGYAVGDSPVASGLYIRRCGNKAEKVVIR